MPFLLYSNLRAMIRTHCVYLLVVADDTERHVWMVAVVGVFVLFPLHGLLRSVRQRIHLRYPIFSNYQSTRPRLGSLFCIVKIKLGNGIAVGLIISPSGYFCTQLWIGNLLSLPLDLIYDIFSTLCINRLLLLRHLSIVGSMLIVSFGCNNGRLTISTM